jgi:outer membrane protein
MFLFLKRIISIALCVFFIPFVSQSQQKKWTLQDCISYAKQNNLSIKIQQYSLDISQANLTQSKGMMLPTVSGYASHSYNYGQTIDRFTNEFASDMVRSNNFYVSANVTVFNGFQLLNSVQKSKFDMLAARYDLESIEKEMSLTIATAFLQILYAMEMKEVARNQYELTLKQVTRTEKMLEVGAVSKSVLLNLRAQAAAEEYQLINMETQFEMALLTLTQLMDLQSPTDFMVQAPLIQIEEIANPLSVDYILSYAVQHQPEIKSAEMRVESAKKSYQISKGGLSPSLTFGASLGTGYSGARQSISGIQVSGFDTVGVTTASPPDYVLAPVFQYLYEPVSFKDQIDQNFNRTIGFNLSIPIFSSLQNTSNIKRGKMNMFIAETNMEQAMMNLNKNIHQAHFDAVSSLKRFYAAEKQVEAAQEVFKFAEERFELDDMNMFEYQDAKNKLTQAQSELMQAKYEFVFKMKVLDFYMGKELYF